MTARRYLLLGLVLFAGLVASASRAGVISVGTPTTSVPTHLADGSYLFGITVNLGPDQFLLPVGITGAVNLQTFQFDLTFDNTVVQQVDPGDTTSGIYGAEFTAGDANSLSFILGGFPFNSLGLVDDVAGSYPALINGPTGDGDLAYILFEFLPGQQDDDPGFGVEDPLIQQQAPEPATIALLIVALAALGVQRRLAHKAARHA